MPAVGSCAVSIDNGALELYLSDPKISEPEAGAAGPDASEEIASVYLNLCGNQWSRDVALKLSLNLVHPHGALVEAVCNSLFTVLAPYNCKIWLVLSIYYSINN